MKKWIYLTLLNLLASTFVFAEGATFYLGASYLDAESSVNEAKDNDSGAQVTLGYAFNSNLSFEASYLDFGTLELPLYADAGGSIDNDGYSISALGVYLVNNFKVIGKAGYLWWEADGVLGSIAGPVQYAADGSEFILGVGLAYKINESFEIKIEYSKTEHFNWSLLGINYYF